ncbi:hypothetical protein ONO12_27745, partial [Salmonella enterica subsp. enterica serovar Montevideo]|nr:hypothetical protein [Salmonella enterica subsp. enterica serovar Montevideo]
VSVLVMIVLWNAGYIIRSMHNIDPALADKAVGYLRALLWGAPKFTEVGYVGKEVDSIIRDLTDAAVKMVRVQAIEKNRYRAEE